MTSRRDLRVSLTGTVAVMLAVLFTPNASLAYVRSKTASGQPYRWTEACLPIQVHLSGLPGLSDAEMRSAVAGAARVWTADANSCTNLQIGLSFLDGPGPPSGNDGHNVIAARPDGWCQPGSAGPTPAACNSPSALAATSVFALSESGRIAGGDTQLNTITFAWARLDDQGQPADKQDLQNALTHEMGHLLGLQHPCWSGIGPRAVDDQNSPVPDCYGAPPELEQDTMFPSINPGDTSKRTLSPDAQRAVCEIYPIPPGTASPAASGMCPAADRGCSMTSSAARSTPDGRIAIVFGILFIAATRRRRA
jgi:hypothetical protein